MLVRDRHSAEPSWTEVVLDRIGTAIAGGVAPVGLRMFLADWCVTRARGYLVFDKEGRRTGMPAPVVDGAVVPRGVMVLDVVPAGDGRTSYVFKTDINFSFFGFPFSSHQLTRLTI